MHRTLYLVGFGYLAICGAVVLRLRMPSRHADPEHLASALPTSSGQGWYAAIKPFCNAVEVETPLAGRSIQPER